MVCVKIVNKKYDTCKDTNGIIMDYVEDFQRCDYYQKKVLKELLRVTRRRQKYVHYDNGLHWLECENHNDRKYIRDVKISCVGYYLRYHEGNQYQFRDSFLFKKSFQGERITGLKYIIQKTERRIRNGIKCQYFV